MLGFSEILGHETVKANLQKAIQAHKISHAYMITGEAGIGKNRWFRHLSCVYFVKKITIIRV